MPSDRRTADEPRTAEAVRLMSRDLETFKATVAITAEDVRRVLERLEAPAEDRAKHLRIQLGRFAEDRIDPTRFSALLGADEPVSRVTTELVAAALTPLDELAKAAGAVSIVRVSPRETIYDAISSTLASVGRAFGAARLVQSIKIGQYRPTDHARSLGSFPFSTWSSSERGVAPPIVAEVSGAQMRVGALSEFMDGRLKIVLVVRGDCPPAPLVRLVSPGAFVIQAADVEGLRAFAAWTGPGVAALVPEQCALFVHDPRGGPQTWDRITVTRLPPARPRKAIAGLSAAQQGEEVELLSMLANAPAVASAPPASDVDEPATDPADKLAAWLLAQADLSGVE